MTLITFIFIYDFIIQLSCNSYFHCLEKRKSNFIIGPLKKSVLHFFPLFYENVDFYQFCLDKYSPTVPLPQFWFSTKTVLIYLTYVHFCLKTFFPHVHTTSLLHHVPPYFLTFCISTYSASTSSKDHCKHLKYTVVSFHWFTVYSTVVGCTNPFEQASSYVMTHIFSLYIQVIPVFNKLIPEIQYGDKPFRQHVFHFTIL